MYYSTLFESHPLRSQTALQTVTPAPVGLLLQSPEGRIQACNAIAEQLLGLSRDALIGQRLTDLAWLPFFLSPLNSVNSDSVNSIDSVNSNSADSDSTDSDSTDSDSKNCVSANCLDQVCQSHTCDRLADRSPNTLSITAPIVSYEKPDGERILLAVSVQPLFAASPESESIAISFSVLSATALGLPVGLNACPLNPVACELNQELEQQVQQRTWQLQMTNQQLQAEIAERQQAETTLRDTKSHLHQLAAANLIGIIFWDIEGEILDANDAFLSMMGYTRDDLAQQRINWATMTPPEWFTLDQHLLHQLQVNGFAEPAEKEYFHKDGSRVPVLIGGTFLEGSRQKGVSFVLNLSDRKRAEQAILQSEQLVRRVLDGLFSFVGLMTPAGILLEANHTALSAASLQPEDVLGKPFEQAYWWSYDPAIQAQLRAAIASAVQGETVRYDVQVRLAEDHFVIIDFALVPLFDAAGNVEYLLPSGIDITERKQIEAERLELLERERLAREAAEAASRTKDEFLAIVSHELRSPLNAILGWAKLLTSRPFDEATTRRALDTIERNAQAQAQLIEDLLDISRIIRGKLRLTLAPVNLVAVIESALDGVRPTAVTKQIELITHLDRSIGKVSGDFSRLQQIVTNLLSNAVKFTPQNGQVTIELSAAATASGLQAVIRVSDTGKGIKPEFLPHVFDRFRQADSTTTRSQEGLGLGLAIVQRLIDLHQGQVTATSPGEGQGATFTVTLPLLEQTTATDPPPETLRSPLNLTGIRILVVDDAPDNCEFLTFVLQEYGAITQAVLSAQAAIDTLPKFQPQILISDISMPEEDGYQLIRRIRALPPQQGGQIPAIALTAHAREEDRSKALRSGFQAHLAKPVEPTALVTTIMDLASR